MTAALAKRPALDEGLMARQLSDQYGRAIGGLMEVVKFGAMMLRLREYLVPARGEGNINNLHKRGEGLDGWLKAHCPTISNGTAYRFMSIAEGLLREFEIGRKVDLFELLSADRAQLAPALLRKRAEITNFLEGKSQRQLLLSLGMGSPSARGGDRGNTHAYGDEAVEAARRREERVWSDVLEALTLNGAKAKTYLYLSTAQLQTLEVAMDDMLRALREEIRTRKAAKRG